MSKTQPRVALFLAPGVEECEALVIYDLLFRASIACDKIAVAPTRSVVSSHNIELTCDFALDDPDFSFDNYDLLFLPGGLPGTTNLQENKKLCDAVVNHHKQGKLLAAVCAAPSVFARLGLLENKRATSNPGFQDVLREFGSVVVQDSYVKTGNIFTSKGLGTCIDLGLALIEELADHDTMEKVKQGIVYMH